VRHSQRCQVHLNMLLAQNLTDDLLYVEFKHEPRSWWENCIRKTRDSALPIRNVKGFYEKEM